MDERQALAAKLAAEAVTTGFMPKLKVSTQNHLADSDYWKAGGENWAAAYEAIHAAIMKSIS